MSQPVGNAPIIPLPPEGQTLPDVMPSEIILSIFSRLSFSDVQSAMLACRRFRELADDNMLRRLQFFRDFPQREQESFRSQPFAWKRRYKSAFLAEANLRKGRFTSLMFNEMGHRERIICLEKVALETKEFYISGSSDGLVQVRRKRGKLTDTVQQFRAQGDFLVQGPFLFLKDGSSIKALKKNDDEFFNEIGLLYSEMQTLSCDGSQIEKMIADDELLLVRSHQGTLKGFTHVLGEFKEVFSQQNIHVIARNKEHLFAITFAGDLLIWKKGNFQQPQVLPKPDPLRQLPIQIHAAEGAVVAVSRNGAVTVWRKNQEGEFFESYFLEGIHVDPVSTSLFEKDYLILGMASGVLEFLNLKSDAFRLYKCSFLHSPYRITAIHFDGKFLVTGAYDNTAKIWEMNPRGSFEHIQTLRSIPCGVTAVQRAGDQILVGFENGKFQAFDFASQ